MYPILMFLNCSGVYLPAFESVTEGGSDFGMTGLGRGGQQVQRLGPLCLSS